MTANFESDLAKRVAQAEEQQRQQKQQENEEKQKKQDLEQSTVEKDGQELHQAAEQEHHTETKSASVEGGLKEEAGQEGRADGSSRAGDGPKTDAEGNEAGSAAENLDSSKAEPEGRTEEGGEGLAKVTAPLVRAWQSIKGEYAHMREHLDTYYMRKPRSEKTKRSVAAFDSARRGTATLAVKSPFKSSPPLSLLSVTFPIFVRF